MTRAWRRQNSDRRKKEAEVRKEEREKRTDQQQLERLNKMFGKDQGAQKERARLKKLIGDNNEDTSTTSNSL